MKDAKSNAVEVVFETPADLDSLFRSMIDGSGMTRYAIAKEAGISESTLSRFYTGTRTPTMETLVNVGRVVGKRVVVRVEDAR
jgi:transcriptional regulator with XRE-family HTH domain